MATLHDFIEVTSISANTTYSVANGNILGVVDNVSGTSLDDGEFDVGDTIRIEGVTYRIDAIRKPTSSGTFTLGDGTTRTFTQGSESNLDAVFLTVSSGGTVRHFIIPNDKYGDIDVQAITTGNLANVSGSDAAIISAQNNQVNVVCFANGALIRVPGGQRAVQDLRKGDLVLTADHGPRPILWIGSHRLFRGELAAHERLRPIRIAPGAFGPGAPARAVMLSPQHRVLVRSRIAERMFGSSEVLVAVQHLLGLPGIAAVLPKAGVEYFHILLERHGIVLANGLPCESLYPGRQALLGLPDRSRTEVLAIMPAVHKSEGLPVPGRRLLTGREGRKLAARHGKHGKPLLEDVAPDLVSLACVA